MLRLFKYSSLYVIGALIFVAYQSGSVCAEDATVSGECDTYKVGDNLWTPSCTDDNFWEPVQCKGERLNGRCFCYDAEGSRLFGWEWWASAEDMTCACSRRRKALEDAGRDDVSLHCSSEGNYDELQCDNGLCWCVEPKTGKPTQRAYPESVMTYLPCYNSTLVGSQYLRQCESAAVARARVLTKLVTHGRQFAHVNAVYCEADGAYGHFRIGGTQIYCTWRNNTQVASYQTELTNILTTNCNCARDVMIFDEEGLIFSQACNNNGNYVAQQSSNGYPYCVDSDGFATTLLGTIGQTLECS